MKKLFVLFALGLSMLVGCQDKPKATDKDKKADTVKKDEGAKKDDAKKDDAKKDDAKGDTKTDK